MKPLPAAILGAVVASVTILGLQRFVLPIQTAPDVIASISTLQDAEIARKESEKQELLKISSDGGAKRDKLQRAVDDLNARIGFPK